MDICDFGNIDIKYYEEAGNELVLKKNRKITYIAAACLAVAFAVMAVIIGKNRTDYVSKVNAAELGEAMLDIGVGMPLIVYSDDAKTIFYDYRGIYVYDSVKEKLTGFADFSKYDMTKIQGSNPTFVNVSDENKIYFYNKDAGYCYDPDTNKVTKSEIAGSINFESNVKITDDYIIEGFTTYIEEDGDRISLVIDPDSDPELIKYKDMRLIKASSNGESKSVILFK